MEVHSHQHGRRLPAGMTTARRWRQQRRRRATRQTAAPAKWENSRASIEAGRQASRQASGEVAWLETGRGRRAYANVEITAAAADVDRDRVHWLEWAQAQQSILLPSPFSLLSSSAVAGNYSRKCSQYQIDLFLSIVQSPSSIVIEDKNFLDQSDSKSSTKS